MFLAPLNYDRYFKKVFSDTAIAQRFLEDFLEIRISSLELLPQRYQVTDDAAVVEFDFRCQIENSYVIIDMQQWYKPDIVQRFYLYHALNTGLQLERLPKEQFVLEHSKRIKKTTDYQALEPVITLIWMADDTLRFQENYVAYTMTPELVVEFLRNDRLWKKPEIQQLLHERERVLAIIENESKNLDFLSTNRLIFAFQKNIVNNRQSVHYDRWFRFAEKTKNMNNTPKDFVEFQEDAIFAEIMRRLNKDGLTDDDLRYIEHEQETWEEVNRLEQGYYNNGLRDGRRKGERIGEQRGKANLSRQIVMRMSKKNKTPDEISDLTGLPVERIREILQEIV